MSKFTESKMKSCVRLARECSRNSWQAFPADRREYLALKRECMADARDYRKGE